MPENTFIGSVHKHLPKSVYHMKLHNPYISGPADVWYSSTRDLWIEYKYVMLPKRCTTVIIPGLTQLQLDWCRTRRAEGRNVLVIVGCKEGGVVLRDERTWELGLPRAAFASQIRSRPDLAAFILSEVS